MLFDVCLFLRDICHAVTPAIRHLRHLLFCLMFVCHIMPLAGLMPPMPLITPPMRRIYVYADDEILRHCLICLLRRLFCFHWLIRCRFDLPIAAAA